MNEPPTVSIDFKKYRTPELFDAISEIMDWRGTVGRGFYYAFFATLIISTLVSLVLIALTYSSWGIDYRLLIVTLASLVYIPLMIPAGVFYSIAYLLKNSLSNMLLVVDLLLESTKKISKDIQSVRSGDSRLPTAKEMVSGVYLEVFLPILEKVISDQLWILAKPSLFIYRLTFGRLMRVVIQSMPEQALLKLTNHESSKDLQATADTLTGSLEEITDHETIILKTLTWTQEKLKTIGTMTKFIVMLPCYAITAIVILINVSVVFLSWLAITFFLYGTDLQIETDDQPAQSISRTVSATYKIVAN